jgi:hypothetical protein
MSVSGAANGLIDRRIAGPEKEKDAAMGWTAEELQVEQA